LETDLEREDLYTLIHKVLRTQLFEVCVQAGATDYGDPHAVFELQDAWQRFDTMLRSHSSHERDYIHPALTVIVPGGTDELDAEHEQVHELLDQVATQFARLTAEHEAEAARRVGLELYRALNRLAAIALPHFDAEETQLMPRLWALLTDQEIAQIRASIMASLTVDETAATRELADRALDPHELGMLRANADAVELAATA
jgi:hypothetical protein